MLLSRLSVVVGRSANCVALKRSHISQKVALNREFLQGFDARPAESSKSAERVIRSATRLGHLKYLGSSAAQL